MYSYGHMWVTRFFQGHNYKSKNHWKMSNFEYKVAFYKIEYLSCSVQKYKKKSFWYVNLKEFCIPKHFRHNRSHASVHIFSDFKYNASFLFNAILSPWVCLYCLISCPGFQPKLYIQRAIKTQSKSCTFALVGQIELSGQ